MAVSGKEHQILSAARTLFLRHGFDGATTDALVSSARVSKETLYRYYATKEDLLIAVIRDLAASRRALGNDIVLPERATRRGFELLLRGLATDAFEQTVRPEYINLLRLVIGESGRRPRIAALLGEALTGAGTLRRLLAQARGQGLVRKDVDVEAAAQMLGGALFGAVFKHGLLGSGVPRASWIDLNETVRLFMRAIS